MSRPNLWFAYCGCGDPWAHLERAGEGAAELAGSVVPDPSVTIEEPVEVAEAKKHCRIDLSDDDNLVELYVSAARVACETYCERAFAEQGYLGIFGVVAATLPLQLHPPPLNAVTKVEKVTTDVVAVTGPGKGKNAATLATEELTGWTLDAITGLLYPPPEGWPVLPDQLRVTFTSGDNDALPTPVKLSILLLTAEYYDNRAAITQGTPVELPWGVQQLLAPYRVSTGVVTP